MNDMGLLGVLAWVLQPGAAVYALRLSRLFGTRRVGWFICAAFLSLALLHIIHLISPRGTQVGFLDVLISILLLIGLAHLDAVFGGQARFEGKQHELRKELRLMSKRNEELEDANRTLHEMNAEREERE